MKSLKIVLTLMIFSLLTLGIYSCGDGKKTDSKTEQTEDATKQGKEYTSDYICPMHCEGSGSEKPGECRVCGMKYKKNDKTTTEDHSGHNH